MFAYDCRRDRSRRRKSHLACECLEVRALLAGPGGSGPVTVESFFGGHFGNQTTDQLLARTQAEVNATELKLIAAGATVNGLSGIPVALAALPETLEAVSPEVFRNLSFGEQAMALYEAREPVKAAKEFYDFANDPSSEYNDYQEFLKNHPELAARLGLNTPEEPPAPAPTPAPSTVESTPSSSSTSDQDLLDLELLALLLSQQQGSSSGGTTAPNPPQSAPQSPPTTGFTYNPNAPTSAGQ